MRCLRNHYILPFFELKLPSPSAEPKPTTRELGSTFSPFNPMAPTVTKPSNSRIEREERLEASADEELVMVATSRCTSPFSSSGPC